ncbi:hypothetical protein CTI14_26595 [Methylobacterium radiotolerans]|nr:hypothetical protein CTI14_26595 [Methylobacterium radiotolerans]
MALCTEAYRAGLGLVRSLMQLVDEGDFTAERLLLLARRTLSDSLPIWMSSRASTSSSTSVRRSPSARPSTVQRSAPPTPTVVSDGLLLDFKAGLKGNALSKEELYQLLGYTFFDRTDRYGIKKDRNLRRPVRGL